MGRILACFRNPENLDQPEFDVRKKLTHCIYLIYSNLGKDVPNILEA
ncbi:hypothetical protein CCP3SC1AL1_1360005 [Gammaproteobacteria bacterium]